MTKLKESTITTSAATLVPHFRRRVELLVSLCKNQRKAVYNGTFEGKTAWLHRELGKLELELLQVEPHIFKQNI